MRIVVAGCWRSGTTGFFNLLRIICEADGPTYATEDGRYNELEGVEHKYQIVKTHKYSDSWRDWANEMQQMHYTMPHDLKKLHNPRRLIFVTMRDEKEIRESMLRFKALGGKGGGTDPANIERGLRYSMQYAHHSFLAPVPFKYFTMPQKTRMLIDRLRKVLDVNVSVNEIYRQYKAIKPPKTGYDPVTLLHANHITKK